MTTKLKAPDGVTAISFAGQQFDVAADGIVTIDGPEEARCVAFLRETHGFTDPTVAKTKKGNPAVTEALAKAEVEVQAAEAAAAQ